MHKVAFVTNSLTGGGAERAINQVVNELFLRNLPIFQIVCNRSAEDFVKVNAPVYEIGRLWQSGLIQTFISILRFNLITSRVKARTLVLNCDLPELFGLLCFRRVDIVVVEHVNAPWVNRRLLGRFVRLGLKLRGARFVAVSDFLQIWPFGDKADVVIQNPIGRVITRGTVSRQEAQQIVKRLFFVGRLVEQKQPNWVLEIAAQTRLPSIFVGEGKLRSELEETASKMNVNANFLGHVYDPWSFLSDSDLLIVPSAYEGDGLVVVEALALGKPILISDIPEFRRFELPDKHYCRSIRDFVVRVEELRYNLRELETPSEITSRLIESRGIEIIGSQWQSYLYGVYERK